MRNEPLIDVESNSADARATPSVELCGGKNSDDGGKLWKKPENGVSEKALTADIRKLLRKHLVFHWKAWQGPMSASGVADIIGIYRGRPLAIEIKGNRGKVSEAQEKFLERFRQAGGLGFVARSVADVIRELQLLVLL